MLSQANALANKTPQVKKQTCFQNNTWLVIISLDQRPIVVELGPTNQRFSLKHRPALNHSIILGVMICSQEDRDEMREIFPIHWLIDFSAPPNAFFLSCRYLRYHFHPCQRLPFIVCLLAILKVVFCQDREIYGYTDTTHITNTMSASCWSDLYRGYNVTFYADLGLTSSTWIHMHTHSNTDTWLFLNA